MKSIQFIIIILFSFVSFSQNYKDKLDEMIGYYNDANDNKYIAIANELLNNNYGKIDNETKFYCEYFLGYNLIIKEDYRKAIDKYKNLLSFSEKNNIDDSYGNIRKCIKDIKSKIKNLEIMIADLPSDENIIKVSEINNGTKKESNKSQETSLIDSLSIKKEEVKTDVIKSEFNNDTQDKPIKNEVNSVTLTVSGTGKTIEEARLNALRSAIEQAFGAFISSKTEILNDNLVKDEIVSISNGNIEKYEIISQVEIPSNGFAITLNTTVSITKLTTFAESKGVVVEFKGGMFGLKIKLQKLNENAEFIAVKNLLSQAFEMLENSIDYSLNVKEPKLIANDLYKVGIEVIENKNINYDKCMNYLINTLSKISISDNEANEITKTGKKLCYLFIDGNDLKFRSEKTINALFNFSLISSMLAGNTFTIKNNLGIVKIPSYSANIFKSFINYDRVTDNDFRRLSLDDIEPPKPEQVDVNHIPIIEYVKKNGFNIDQLLEAHIEVIENSPIYRYNDFLKIDTKFNYSTDYEKDGLNLNYDLEYPLSYLEKIQSFKIDKIPFEELIINRTLYREFEARLTWGSCFLKGTSIRTPKGTILIENIKVGDDVVCFDEKGELHTSIVESVNKHENQEVYKYNVWNGAALYATPNHWVLTSENSFTEIGKLNELLTLVDINGGLKPITKVEYFGKETVYNFIVKDYHTYIANDIRVHNGGKGKWHLNISEKITKDE